MITNHFKGKILRFFPLFVLETVEYQRNNGQKKCVIKNLLAIRNHLVGSILVKIIDRYFKNWHLVYLIMILGNILEFSIARCTAVEVN